MSQLVLTTITPYWKRPDILKLWVQHLKRATLQELFHLVYFVGELPPTWWNEETRGMNIKALVRMESPGQSIGCYHNIGAEQAVTEWMMKLDVDAFPHENYFKELLPVLRTAGEREWFNGGMFYLNYWSSLNLIGKGLTLEAYKQVMNSRRAFSDHSYTLPEATNFICRRQQYLALGGCDIRFKGYGWEDYQQIYMLERHQRGADPLPGEINFENVAMRCREEISRPKARELWKHSFWLSLLHHHHTRSPKFSDEMHRNRLVLLDYITKCRS